MVRQRKCVEDSQLLHRKAVLAIQADISGE